MTADPRVLLAIALITLVVAGLWLISAWVFADWLHQSIGDLSFVLTLVALLAFFSAIVVSFIFYKLHVVKRDLSSGRNVIARWRISSADLDAFRKVALTEDDQEKRQALFTMFAFILVIFGAIAAFDQRVAAPMMITAVSLMLVLSIAYAVGKRITTSHLTMRSGEVIIGKEGVLVNDVLHVWAVPLSRLSDAGLANDVMYVDYAYWGRSGPQCVTIRLPVTAESRRGAEKAVQALVKLANE